MNKLERFSSEFFTKERWESGSLSVFGIETRTNSIEKNREIIKKYAIGYIEGDKLFFRPKNNTFAVMFWFNEIHFWTHLTKEEFEICFKSQI
jgi:hypothetical protein